MRTNNEQHFQTMKKSIWRKCLLLYVPVPIPPVHKVDLRKIIVEISSHPPSYTCLYHWISKKKENAYSNVR
jgi:hypothetical protein